MSKLRVAWTTADSQAVGKYRVEWPLNALVDQGDVEAVNISQLDIDVEFGLGGRKRVVSAKIPDADVLILQRPTNCFIADAIPFFQKAGVAVVVDLDDDLQFTAHKHSQQKLYDPLHNSDENWAHLKRACQLADMVTVSTEPLKRYAPHGRVEIIRNCVPAAYLDIPRNHDGRTIGWGGTVMNHPYDLQVTNGGVAQALRETGSRFLVVGDGDAVKQNLNLDSEPDKTGMVSIEDYPYEVAKFTIGIAPLSDDKFNKSKSALKILEYSALGIPWVASQSHLEYQYLREFLYGDLVSDRGRSWKNSITSYLEDKAIIVSDSEHNRQAVRDNFTIEDNAGDWSLAWQRAVLNLQGVAV